MSALRARGVGKGDRIAVVGSNSIETLVVFLATAGVGGIVSTSSTDMGVRVRGSVSSACFEGRGGWLKVLRLILRGRIGRTRSVTTDSTKVPVYG